MIRMSQKARDAAKTLAVAYAAYHEAIERKNLNGICVYGRMLLEAQIDTGVQMHTPSLIEADIKAARAKKAA